jgi:putative transposase
MGLMKQSRAYQGARTLPKKTVERTDAFKAARAAYGFTDAALQSYAKDCRHDSGWIELHLDAPVSQKLATRASRAVNRVALGKATRVRFKGKHQLDSVEGKSNVTGLVWQDDRLEWRGLTLPTALPPRWRHDPHRDPVLAHGLAAPVKYVRLVRRRINGNPRFWMLPSRVSLPLLPKPVLIRARHRHRLRFHRTCRPHCRRPSWRAWPRHLPLMWLRWLAR